MLLSRIFWAFLMTKTVKNLYALQETQIQSLGQEDPLEKELATLSSILAWEVSRMERGACSPWGSQELDTT